MQRNLDNMAGTAPYNDVIDDIWEVSKCQAIIKSCRRRLLYMGIKPSQHIKSPIFKNITEKFIPYIKKMAGIPSIHEDLATNEVYGELDLRVGTTIIDYKASVSSDEITAPWLLQSLAYKAMHDLSANNTKITHLAWFNPIKGWYVSIDVSDWDKHEELLAYLLSVAKH
jgi:hypothetical protein